MQKILSNTGQVKSGIILLLFAFIYVTATAHDLTVKELMKKAEQAVKIGDPYTAIDLYKQAVAKDDKNFEAAFNLAELCRLTRDYGGAEDLYKHVYEKRSGEYPMAEYYYGLMAKRNEKYDLAIELLSNVAKKYKGPDLSYYKRAAKFELEGAELALKLKAEQKNLAFTHLGSSVNSAYTEFSPIFLNDSTMIYSSIKSDTIIVMPSSKKLKSEHKAKLYVAGKSQDDWISAGLLDGPFNASNAESGNGTFSPDGQRFYFTRCNLNKENKMICAIYVSEKKKDSWSTPQRLDDYINVPGYTSTEPCVALDPKHNSEVIYFASDKPGGRGGLDIWFTIYNDTRKTYMRPRNAGGKINSTGDDMTPFYDQTYQQLYFSSDGWPTVGGLDIFKNKGSETKWRTKPQNIGFPANSGADDMYYNVNYDIDRAFIVSNRRGSNSLKNPTCCDDIFEMEIDRPLVFGLDGLVKYLDDKDSTIHPLKDANVKLSVHYDMFEAEFVDNDSTDDKGFFFFDLDRDKDYVLTVSKKGFFTHKSEVLSTKGLIKSDTLHHEAILLQPIPRTPVVINNIYYDFDKATLTDSSKITLDNTILKIMRNNPNIILEIRSHTDSHGDDAYNMQLSQARAESVVNYLIQNGIEKERLKATGFGESQPIAPNTNPDGSDNPEGRQKNRRTEFMVIGELSERVDLIYKE